MGGLENPLETMFRVWLELYIEFAFFGNQLLPQGQLSMTAHLIIQLEGHQEPPAFLNVLCIQLLQ